MRNLLALLLFVPSLCLAQLPDHVPLENLRGWYPLDGNVLDFSGNDHHGLNIGVTFTFDRNGEMNKAGDFDGLSSHITGNISSWTPTEESTLSLWLHPRGDAGGQPYDLFFQLGEYGNHTFAYGYNYSGENLDLYSNCHWNPYYSININNEWHHLAIVDDATESSIFLDGVLLHSWSSGSSSWCYQGSSSFLIGGGADNQYTTGYIDDVGIWNRALTELEIAQLYEGSSLTFGCTDPAACNYDATAEGDDGSCEYGCLYCGENTFWDSTLQQCVTIAPPCAPSCGEGTVWDPVNEECIIAVPTDTDFNGCVTAGDVLNLLATFGTCPPYPEWPEEPTDTTWTCGDAVTYWDHDYATVLIGDQCWFAENLRTEQYRNGEVIPAGLDDTDWAGTQEGASSVYGEGNSDCSGPCDEIENLGWHGRLYNFEAVSDPRGLCPTGWQAPSESHVNLLVDGLGGFSSAAPELAMTDGFGGFGTGSTGLDLLPQGWKNPSGHYSLSDAFFMWTKTETLPNEASYYSMNPYATGIASDSHWFGMSVRCVKD